MSQYFEVGEVAFCYMPFGGKLVRIHALRPNAKEIEVKSLDEIKIFDGAAPVYIIEKRYLTKISHMTPPKQAKPEIKSNTPEELEEQTVTAYAAWRKCRSTQIQCLSCSGEWCDCTDYPHWDNCKVYRIKPEPPKPVEVEVLYRPSDQSIMQYDEFTANGAEALGYVRTTATISVKEGE